MKKKHSDKYYTQALGGAYRTCPVCGKKWYIVDVEMWGYTRWVGGKKTGGKHVQYCSWSCLRKWEKDHPPKKEFLHPTVPANSDLRWYR